MNIKRKIVSFLLAAIMVIPIVPITAAADDPTTPEQLQEGCSYTLSKNDDGANTYTAVIGIGSSGSAAISLDGTDLAENYKDKVTRIQILDGVEEIGPHCFSDFTALRHISLPDTLQTIGPFALDGCVCLQDIDLPETVTTIGESALNDTCCIPSSVDLPTQCSAYGDPLETAKIFYDVKPDNVSPDAEEGTTYLSQFEESYTAITELLSELAVDDMDNDLEKIKTLYRWVTDNVSFDTDAYYHFFTNTEYIQQHSLYAQTAHSALFAYMAISEGYVDLLETMLKESGIRCIECHGERRAWLIVEFNDIWYAVDPTMDSGVELSDYLYFFKTYEHFAEFDHVWTLPEGFTDVYSIAQDGKGAVIVDDCEYVLFPGYAMMTRYRGNGPTVTLPQTVEYKGVEYPVTCIGGNAFFETSDLREVIVPAGYESITLCAFNNCNGLDKVTLPPTIQSISYGAMQEMSISDIAFDGTSDQLLGTELFKMICRSFNPDYITCTDGQCANPYCLANATIDFSPKRFVYNGKQQLPTITVTATDGTVLTNGEDYLVYVNDDDISTAKGVDQYTIAIEGIGEYYGSAYSSDPFIISPQATVLKKLKSGKKMMTVTWTKKTTQVKGYQIQYARNKKFTKGKKTKTIKSNKTTSCKIKKLKSKKTYYVRVRTYKYAVSRGGNLYSKWSKVKKVKIK